MGIKDENDLLQAADKALEEGRVQDAEQICAQILSQDPDHVSARLIQVEAFIVLGDFDGALRVSQESVNLEPENFEARLLASEVALAVNEPVLAAEMCEPVLMKEPGNLMARQQMGEAMLQLENFADAGALFETVVVEEEDNVDGWLGLGVAKFHLGEYELSIGALAEAKKLAPDMADIYQHLGLNYERKGDDRSAKQAFKRAQKLSPEDFFPPLALSISQFESLIDGVCESLPEELAPLLKTVRLQVEEWPSESLLGQGESRLSPTIWSFVEATEREDQPVVLRLFRRNLMRDVEDEADLAERLGAVLHGEFEAIFE